MNVEKSSSKILRTPAPVVQALRQLQLDVDFSQAVMQTAENLRGKDARVAAAQVVYNLSEAEPGADSEQQKRLKLAEVSYTWKVSSRPKTTSAAYSSGKRHFKVELRLVTQEDFAG